VKAGEKGSSKATVEFSQYLDVHKFRAWNDVKGENEKTKMCLG